MSTNILQLMIIETAIFQVSLHPAFALERMLLRERERGRERERERERGRERERDSKESCFRIKANKTTSFSSEPPQKAVLQSRFRS